MMTYLKDYASFVRNSKLEDFVSVYLMNIHSFNIPLLQLLSHLTEEQLLATTRESLLKLLTGFEKETAINQVKISLENWNNNNVPGIPREAVSLKDITLIYAAQKQSVQTFIQYYTTE